MVAVVLSDNIRINHIGTDELYHIWQKDNPALQERDTIGKTEF